VIPTLSTAVCPSRVVSVPHGAHDATRCLRYLVLSLMIATLAHSHRKFGQLDCVLSTKTKLATLLISKPRLSCSHPATREFHSLNRSGFLRDTEITHVDRQSRSIVSTSSLLPPEFAPNVHVSAVSHTHSHSQVRALCLRSLRMTSGSHVPGSFAT
jgi:hypothetical protein